MKKSISNVLNRAMVAHLIGAVLLLGGAETGWANSKSKCGSACSPLDENTTTTCKRDNHEPVSCTCGGGQWRC